ncbi:hypothetical protein WJX74_008167 [Apatococcus lobatus]|uniref:Uncharacterized protein n=1 Tax=Apatococcus lobatus TaxID=904363 RepID=A0AAW1QWX1_9CHLO
MRSSITAGLARTIFDGNIWQEPLSASQIVAILNGMPKRAVRAEGCCCVEAVHAAILDPKRKPSVRSA